VIKHLLVPALILLISPAFAEEKPVPPPPPVIDPTVPAPPVPPPPPTGEASAAAAPEVQPAAPTPSPTTDAKPVVGDRVAAAAGRAAAAEKAKAVSLRLELDGGYDTNVLREDSNTPTATDTEGWALGGEVKGTWRAIRDLKGQLNIIGDARYNSYPDESTADLGRVGIAAFGLLRLGGIDPGAVIGANRQWIDGEGVATILRGSALVTRLSPGRAHFDSVSVDFYNVDYDDNEDASGVLGDVLWRHWWMPEAGNAKRRVELTLMAGIYSADVDTETYSTIKPGVAVVWRAGERENPLGIWDLQGLTSYDYRRYEDGEVGEDAERQSTWQISATADRWIGSWLSVGPFISYSLRDSTRDGRDYDRVQVGARLIADW
jgi:hypothetical protein